MDVPVLHFLFNSISYDAFSHFRTNTDYHFVDNVQS